MPTKQVRLYLVTYGTRAASACYKVLASQQAATAFVRRLQDDADVRYVDDIGEIRFEDSKQGLIHAIEYGVQLARRKKTRSKSK